MSIVQAISRPGARRSRPSAAEDAKLVARVRAGDERAFEAIFKRHHAPLLSYARHMLANQDEAEDALQQAFIRAHRALLGGTAPRELRPWLYAIVRNCCLSAIAARRHTVELDERIASLAGLSEVVHEREDLRELLADVGRLPEDQRSALLLAELDDLSHQSIATIVGCPVTKVKALVYQARSALIADRDARGASCRDIREELAVARGGELRRGPLRRHLGLCVGCRDFQQALAVQRRSLAVALPVLPSAGLAAKILSHSVLQAAGAAGQAGSAIGSAAAPAGAVATPAAVAGGGASAGTAASTAAATGASAAAGGGGTGVVVGSGVLAKVAVGGAVAALATAGAVTTVHRLSHPHRRHLAQAQLVDSAHRSRWKSGARPQTQPSTVPGTFSADVSTAASGETASAPEPAASATSDTALSSPLSPAAPQSPQTPILASAPLSPTATGAATAPTGTQAPSGQGTQPQGGSSGPTAPVVRHPRRLESQRRRQQRLRRLRQAERERLQAQRRRLAREERQRKARELKEARERRKRLREERQRKARELKEAKELRERLREERQHKAQELKEARERRELEVQRKREQREAAAAVPTPAPQTSPSTTPVTTTTPSTEASTEASSTASTEATGTTGKRKRKKS
jgi:RNA polymerase sigma factor (sigma-70 family)